MNRRDVARYLSLIGVAAASMPGDWAAAAGESEERAGSLCAVIHDGRYSDARRFGAVLGARGMTRLTTAGDAVTVWIRDCRSRLTMPTWRVAGLTTYSDFMLLRTCARECGGATLHEGLHDFRRTASIVHAVRAGRAGEMLARALRRDDWTVCLAQALACAPLHALGADERTIHTEGGRAASDHPGTLVSWVIGRG